MAAKRRKRKPPVHADHGTPELRQHGEFVEDETMVSGFTRLRNVTVDPIATYWRRGQIERRHYDAAERFSDAFHKANLGADYSMMKWNERINSPPSTTQNMAIAAARFSVREALKYVGLPLATIIETVVGYGQNAGSWQGVAQSKRREQEGMTALRLALDGLARYYKM
jgi:hypothetical protein